MVKYCYQNITSKRLCSQLQNGTMKNIAVSFYWDRLGTVIIGAVCLLPLLAFVTMGVSCGYSIVLRFTQAPTNFWPSLVVVYLFVWGCISSRHDVWSCSKYISSNLKLVLVLRKMYVLAWGVLHSSSMSERTWKWFLLFSKIKSRFKRFTACKIIYG